MSADGPVGGTAPQGPPEGMTLTRHLPPGATPEQVVSAVNQVIDQLAAQADADDDPTTRRQDVRAVAEPGPDGVLVVRGFLDATPSAPYLEPDHDPYEGVPASLRALVRDDPPAVRARPVPFVPSPPQAGTTAGEQG